MAAKILDLNRQLVQKWAIAGQTSDNFVDLSQVTGLNQPEVCSDRLLLLILCIASSKMGQPLTDRTITSLLRNSLVWYPNYFSEDLVWQSGASNLWFREDVATCFYWCRQARAKIYQLNKHPEQQIFCRSVLEHCYLRRHPLCKKFYGHSLNQFFQNCQILLYDSHHLRWLHFLADDASFDLLLCLETGMIGVLPVMFEAEANGVDIELYELVDVPLFGDRLYFPTFTAKLIFHQDSSTGKALGQMCRFWLEQIEPSLTPTHSAKKSVLDVLFRFGYQSPFGVNH